MAGVALDWPVRGALTLARQLGLSRRVARLLLRHAMSPRRIRRAFAGYRPTAHDVFVCAYARSGTNWMMQMVVQTAHRGAAEFDHIHDLVPWPEAPGPGPVALDDARNLEAAPTGLRAIKTHGAPGDVPVHPDARYIVVLRDPKEVLVSSYHFAPPLLGMGDDLTPADWLELTLAEHQRGGSRWLRHALGWWALRDEPNVLLLTFAEMKADPDSAVDRVAAHLGVELTDDERAAVIERSSLPWMRAHESQFTPVRVAFIEPVAVPRMIRRGASGGADELYDEAAQARVDAAILDDLAQRDASFPYRELFMDRG